MADRNQFRLLGERRFAPFFVTQFLGALNDNVYKNALVILVAFHATSLKTLAPEVLVPAATIGIAVAGCAASRFGRASRAFSRRTPRPSCRWRCAGCG